MVAKDINNNAVLMRNEAMDTLNKIQKLKSDIEDAVMGLNNYTSTDGPVISDSVALLEANLLLNRMKNRGFGRIENEAERILDYCTEILNKTLYMNGHFPELWYLKERSHLLLSKLKELESHLSNAMELALKV